MIKLAVSGALGRMGQRITHLASEDKTFKITTLLENANHPRLSETSHERTIATNPSSLKGSQVLIEFTSPQATLEHLDACLKYKVKMVIGTTGFSDTEIRQIKKASQKIPIVFSSNMSVGVNLVFKLLKEAASTLGSDYKIKIVEGHHIHKKDAPSGTAKTMAQVIEDNSKHKVSDIKSIREGEIIGDHDVVFESDVDVIKIFHHAKTRDIFAKGSIVAAKFVAKKTKGLFNMQDVLGLK